MRIIISFLLLTFLSACGSYSFTGASISPDVKSVSIKNFPNQASLVQPRLSQLFTEQLKDKFVSQTNLSVQNGNADLNFEGSIKDYTTAPVSIQSGDVAALTRLSITVNVKFTNIKDPKQDFESSFTRYADYSSSKTLIEVEDALIKEINAQLVDDIFNKAVVNW
jgi:hypothetical protein